MLSHGYCQKHKVGKSEELSLFVSIQQANSYGYLVLKNEVEVSIQVTFPMKLPHVFIKCLYPVKWQIRQPFYNGYGGLVASPFIRAGSRGGVCMGHADPQGWRYAGHQWGLGVQDQNYGRGDKGGCPQNALGFQALIEVEPCNLASN